MFIDKQVQVTARSLACEIMRWETGTHTRQDTYSSEFRFYYWALLFGEESLLVSIPWMSRLAYSDNHWIFNTFNGLCRVTV